MHMDVLWFFCLFRWCYQILVIIVYHLPDRYFSGLSYGQDHKPDISTPFKVSSESLESLNKNMSLM